MVYFLRKCTSPPSGLSLHLILDGYNCLANSCHDGGDVVFVGCVDDDDVGNLDSFISGGLGHLRPDLVGFVYNPFHAGQGFDDWRCGWRRGPSELSPPDAGALSLAVIYTRVLV